MKYPTPLAIAPHSLVYDGARWHARSWCYNRSHFSDLARILSIGDSRPSGIDAAIDREWRDFFTMELAPHPSLSETQRQAIEMDYGMENGVVGITMRLCMTPYFERHYGLDLPSEQLPPSRRQVVLRNRSELDLLRTTYGAAKDPVRKQIMATCEAFRSSGKQVSSTAASGLHLKRNAFRYEHEVRLLWIDRSHLRPGQLMDFDPVAAFEQIMVGPSADLTTFVTIAR